MDIFDILLLGTVTFLISGSIKGLTGIGLPTVSLGILTLFVAPRLAIALMLLPMLMSNLWQVLREGEVWASVLRFRVFAAVIFVTVGVTALVTQDVHDRVLLAVLGCVILLFVGFSFKGWVPRVPPEYDTAAQGVFGLIAGVLGGLTSGWAAPLAIYLTMARADKSEFIRGTGLLIFAGSVPLTLAYLWTGQMTAQLFGLSALMLVPTFAGFAVGEALRNKLSVRAFRNVVLGMFAILGLNLLRRAIWYV
ncbi:MAG: sulfite exporter TauE/SafE family protein [Paracoccaceae bacterium]